MSNPKTVVEIGGDNSGLKKALAESGGLVGKFATDMASVQSVAAQSIQGVGGGFATMAIKAIGGFASLAATVGAAAIVMANNTANAANEVSRMSDRAGIGAQDLSKLSYAFNISSVSSEELGQGLKGLAVKMNEAANGNEEALSTFKSLGVEVKDAAGKMRPIQDVLFDVADAFKQMPDGAQKSALAVKLMEESGLKLLPVLNQGAESIRKFGKEAEDIGVIFTPEQLAAAKEWELNINRLKAAGTGFAYTVGNEIIPHLARLSTILLENKSAGLGWFDSFIATLNGASDPAKRVSELTEKLAKLKAELAADKEKNKQDGGSIDTSDLEKNVEKTERALKYFTHSAEEAAHSVEKAESEAATKRADLEQKLATKKAELAKYASYIQTGEQGLIETNAKASIDRQIADQQRLIEAVRNAWQQTRKDADKARADAASLTAQAGAARTAAADRAAQMRDSGLSEEEKQAANASRAEEMLSQGRYYAAAAGAAQLDGRAKDFEQYAKQAKEFLERAQKFAEASANPDTVETIGKQQAGLLDIEAKTKQREAADLDAQAARQAELLNGLQGKLDVMKESARAIEVRLKTDTLIKDIADIESVLAKLTSPRQIPIGALPTGPITVPADTPARAYGGPLPGSAPHDRADNMLYWGTPGEWVIQRPAVRHYGTALISALNEMRLPKYALGGQLGHGAFDRLNIPSINLPETSHSGPDAPGTTVVLDFGKMGRFETAAKQDVAKEIVSLFRNAAYRFGRD